jgi:hypothetical protein
MFVPTIATLATRQRTQAGGRGEHPQEGLLEIKKALEQGASSKIAIARDQVGDSIAALRIRCMSLSASTFRMIFTPRSPSSRINLRNAAFARGSGLWAARTRPVS